MVQVEGGCLAYQNWVPAGERDAPRTHAIIFLHYQQDRKNYACNGYAPPHLMSD